MAADDSTRSPGIYGPKFQERRLEALARDGYRCCACNHDGSLYRLEVHHRTYEHGSDPLLEDLYTFCVRCHDVWTDIMRDARYSARNICPSEVPSLPERGRPVPVESEDIGVVEIRPAISVKIVVPDKCDVQVLEVESRTRAKPNL